MNRMEQTLRFLNKHIIKTLSEIKQNPWDHFAPSTPIIYLSFEKSHKILLYKYMAML